LFERSPYMSEKPVRTRPCEVCGKPIEALRLEAVPDTRLCEEHGRQVNEFIYVRQERVVRGKESSLKGTGIEITQKKSRNTAAIKKLREAYRNSGPA
jgi:hypothetical protein